MPSIFAGVGMSGNVFVGRGVPKPLRKRILHSITVAGDMLDEIRTHKELKLAYSPMFSMLPVQITFPSGSISSDLQPCKFLRNVSKMYAEQERNLFDKLTVRASLSFSTKVVKSKIHHVCV